MEAILGAGAGVFGLTALANFIIGMFCAALVSRKGYSFGPQVIAFFVGLLFSLIALIYYVGVPVRGETQFYRGRQ